MLAWRHTFEEVSAGIVIVVWAGCDAEEVVASVAVVVVDAEVPASIGEDYGAMEVAVAYNAVPKNVAEECAESHVARCAYSEVVVVETSVGDIVEVVVDSPDVVIVDAVYLIDEEWVSDAEGICHAVGEETGIVANCYRTHALCVHCYCSCHEEKGCE